jgi:hypothetical protein
MKRLSIASLVMVGGLTGCGRADRMAGQSGVDSSPVEMLVLLLAAVVLYLVFSALLTSRALLRVWSRHRRNHRHRGQGPDSGIDHGASATDSVLRPR